MKITTDYSNCQTDLIEIKEATYINDFVISLVFNDGVNRFVSFKQFLISSLHPSIKKYNNEVLFQQFKIVEGNLNWNNYDMIFPISDLYDGKIT